MKLTVVGLDPSMSNFGMIKGKLDMKSGVLSDLNPLLVSTFPKGKAKKQIRTNSHDLVRAQTIYESMERFIADVSVCFVEVPVGSQSARSMTNYGVCIGLLASIKCLMIQVTPTEVKEASVGSKTASKAEMIKWATTKFPNVDWLTHRGKLTNKNEHLADALATIYAGVRTDDFKKFKTIHDKL